MTKGYVCPECGLDYDTLHPPDMKVAVRSFPRRYRQALAAARDDEAEAGLVRRRPDPKTWSALEYTAHMADGFARFAETIRRMYTEDRPTLESYDPDERAEAERYNDQDADVVLDRLRSGAERLAAELDRVDADGWRRTAAFPWGERDILAMARNAVHEGSHHLRDIERVLDAARRSGR